MDRASYIDVDAAGGGILRLDAFASAFDDDVHQVYGAGIRIHDLRSMSLLP